MHTEQGDVVAAWRADDGPVIPALAPGAMAELRLDVSLPLTSGSYTMEFAALSTDSTEVLCRVPRLACFSMAKRPSVFGVVDLDVDARVEA